MLSGNRVSALLAGSEGRHTGIVGERGEIWIGVRQVTGTREAAAIAMLQIVASGGNEIAVVGIDNGIPCAIIRAAAAIAGTQGVVTDDAIFKYSTVVRGVLGADENLLAKWRGIATHRRISQHCTPIVADTAATLRSRVAGDGAVDQNEPTGAAIIDTAAGRAYPGGSSIVPPDGAV